MERIFGRIIINLFPIDPASVSQRSGHSACRRAAQHQDV